MLTLDVFEEIAIRMTERERIRPRAVCVGWYRIVMRLCKETDWYRLCFYDGDEPLELYHSGYVISAVPDMGADDALKTRHYRRCAASLLAGETMGTGFSKTKMYVLRMMADFRVGQCRGEDAAVILGDFISSYNIDDEILSETLHLINNCAHPEAVIKNIDGHDCKLLLEMENLPSVMRLLGSRLRGFPQESHYGVDILNRVVRPDIACRLIAYGITNPAVVIGEIERGWMTIHPDVRRIARSKTAADDIGRCANALIFAIICVSIGLMLGRLTFAGR